MKFKSSVLTVTDKCRNEPPFSLTTITEVSVLCNELLCLNGTEYGDSL